PSPHPLPTEAIHSALAQLHQGTRLLNQGNVEQAIAHYRRAIALNPNAVEAYQYLAEALTQQGALAEAAECYRRAIELTESASSSAAADQTEISMETMVFHRSHPTR
ncbi:MAG: tetratricopeptide repeat protein, partial [Cyanobacteria bacterium CRU_2_1]|nr:tetratricopeptide repeat protein [Cyanobacteria bacterium CRU_2_1]